MTTYPFIVDGHLDLSMNAMEWNRDLRLDTLQIRELERGMNDKPDRGNSTLSFPAMRQGNIGLCLATLIARYAKPNHPLGGWRSPEQAWAMTQAQLAWYREMERQGFLRQIVKSVELTKHIDQWTKSKETCPIGYVLTLEGADSIISMDYLHLMYKEGLRVIGPAHYGPGTYAFGTNSEGGIGVLGRELLREMDSLKMILDTTHLCDISFWEALETFQGPIWASHSNCRTLVNHNRQFSDEQIKELIARDAIIGLPFDAWMMVPRWEKGVTKPSPSTVTLNHMIDHMDHICMIAGDTKHVALGTDLDGGFGREQCPSDINTIADLQNLPPLLKDRGYDDSSINDLLKDNWIRILYRVLD